MKDDALVIDGKNYVSSARAAQLVGYTKDYVGQLARAGKIDSKLIGRSWYVSEDSITQHKLTVHYTLTKPKKPRRDKESVSISRTSDKTILNKDISSIGEGIHVALRSHNVEKTPENLPVFYTEGEQAHADERDLYPKPRKENAARDPLLHSEIFYEKYEDPVVRQPSEEKQIKSAKERVAGVDGAVLPVHILRAQTTEKRRPAPFMEHKMIGSRSIGSQSKRVAMNDIIFRDTDYGSHREHTGREQRDTGSFDNPPQPPEMDEYAEDLNPHRFHTRLVSFFGATIVIIGIVILYVLA